MVEDVDGNRFLDMTAGIAVTATGHAHPEVIRAIKEQSEKFLHMCAADFYYAVQAELAEALATRMPGSDAKRVFLCNSGTEAVEAAIKLARYHTGRENILAFYGSFHGRSYGSLSLTMSKKVQRERFAPLLPGVHHARFPNPQRCPKDLSPEAYATKCVKWISDEFLDVTVPAKEVAAVVVEAIQGEGGYIVPPKNFHQELQNLCRQHNILYIVDEIQSGMGRTGKLFACEHFGVEPDMITMAKGLASGLPLGALICRDEVMDWTPGAHGSTFGGNPLSCAAALKTLELVEGGLMDNAVRQGASLKEALAKLQAKYPLMSDVRGLGLMTAIEVSVEDSKEKSVSLRDDIIHGCFAKGMLVLGCGTKSIRFSPALLITQEEIDVAVQILDSVLGELS